MIKAVLFDLDGVLVDACDWHYEALNDALYDIAGFKISREDHEMFFNGLPTKVKLQKLFDEGKIERWQMNDVWNAKQKYTKQTIKQYARPDPEKRRLHDWLFNQNIRTACVTNSITETAELMLQETDQFRYLILISNQNVKKPKPDPEGYIQAMSTFNVSPKETLIVEDSPHGLQAARASGANILPVKNSTEVTLDNLKRTMGQYGSE